MKEDTFPRKILTELRNGIPQGAQTRIAQALTTPEQTVTPRDVSQVLRGIRKRVGKIEAALIIKEAARIYKEVKAANSEALEILNDAFDTTN